MERASKPRRRIFISYGHDEHAALATRLKQDLVERGYEVWLDSDKLVPGSQDWEHSIEQGIDWVAASPDNGRVIFLVTPHSTRRPDGFCLNELTRALEKKLRIVPVMVVWCELPLSICRYQWLDLRDCVPLDACQDRYALGLEKILQAIEHEHVDQECAASRLRQYLEQDLLQFDADIERHLATFEGRQWLIDAVDAWLADPNAGRLFWLTGKPGSGKTAFASWLCRHKPEIVAVYLCSYDNAHKADPRSCVLSIAYQLSTQLKAYHDRLAAMDIGEIVKKTDPLTLFDALVAQPISYAFPKPDRSVVVVIDALDEAGRNHQNKLAEFLVDCIPKTPSWFRFILTSRPDQDVLHPLQAYSPRELDTSSAHNRADIRAYLAKHLPQANGGSPVSEGVIDHILQRSEGIFLYVHCVLDDIRQGLLRLDRLADFPQGLGGYYARFFKRQFPLDGQYAQGDGSFTVSCRLLLELMAAARRALRSDEAAALLGWDEYRMEGCLHAFGALLLCTDGTVRPFHRTLLEWLTDKPKAGRYYVSLEAGHRRLAEAGWAEFQHGAESMSEYARDHLAAHLIATRRWDDVKAFLTHPIVMQRLMEEERRYELLGYWLAIGDNIDLAQVYTQAIETCGYSGISEVDMASLCWKTAGFLQVCGKYDAALLLGENSLEIRQNILGHEHLDIAKSCNVVANQLWFMGRYGRAEPFYRRALAIREKTLGSEHSDVATSLDNLATLLRAQGDTAGAEPLYRRALAIREKALGPEHPDVASSLNNLAVLLHVKGDKAGAEPLYRRALAIREKALGPEHPDVATSLNNLAVLLRAQGDTAGAEPLYRRALAIREKGLGPEHPDVATSLNNLAILLRAQGDTTGAEPLHRRALDIREKTLGSEHPDVAGSLNNLAVLLHGIGDAAGAERLYRRALEIYERTLGTDHPDVVGCKENFYLLMQ